MISNGKQGVRRRFSGCLRRAERLLNAVTKHKGTNPTFKKVAMIMKLRTSVEAQFFHMEEDLDVFLQCDRGYLHYEDFRAELADLGKATGEVVDQVLSKSKEFLGRLSDVGLPSLKDFLFEVGWGDPGLRQQKRRGCCRSGTGPGA